MLTQNVNLTETQAEFIRKCVDSGDYNNASELVREALRLLQAQKDEQQAKLQQLRAELQKGYDAREEGRFITLDTKAKRATYFEDVNRRGQERLLKEANGSPTSTE
ncbi:MAG: type II toxin-antitoxin system ParD family antitoxin [Candidatus Hydrogenedentes bacterium]|nr:type II toxin-antitoxin system ParD family antitoxin [Candidatus Hydrogenedentota bacterium]